MKDWWILVLLLAALLGIIAHNFMGMILDPINKITIKISRR